MYECIFYFYGPIKLLKLLRNSSNEHASLPPLVIRGSGTIMTGPYASCRVSLLWMPYTNRVCLLADAPLIRHCRMPSVNTTCRRIMELLPGSVFRKHVVIRIQVKSDAFSLNTFCTIHTNTLSFPSIPLPQFNLCCYGLSVSQSA